MRLSGTGAILAGLLLSTYSAAQPTIRFDAGTQSTLQVVSDTAGPLAVELLLDDIGHWGLFSAELADPTVFDTPFAATNPLTGAETSGLVYTPVGFGGEAFVSISTSGVVGPGTYDLLTIESGLAGDIDGSYFNGVEVSGSVTNGSGEFAVSTAIGIAVDFFGADADFDGDVDGDDLIAVQTQFGMSGPTPLLGDADRDGDVDGDDLISVQTEFGGSLSVAIPEPATAALLVLPALLAPRRRRSVSVLKPGEER